MKSRILIAAAATAALVTVAFAAEIKLENVKCVVATAKPAKAGTEVDYKGGKVFFCCMNCPKAFQADKAKFATKANHQLAVTAQAKEVKCPLTGEDLNPDTALMIAGAKVAFCCENCKGDVQKATAEQQLEMVFSDKAFEKGFKVETAK